MSTSRSPRQQSRHLPAFILLILGEKPLHGGALQTTLGHRLPGLKADSAAVYRSLKQLEKDGEVQSNWVTADSGPPIRVYELTDAGWAKLDYWLNDVKERLDNLNYFVTGYEKLKEGNRGARENAREAPVSKRKPVS